MACRGLLHEESRPLTVGVYMVKKYYTFDERLKGIVFDASPGINPRAVAALEIILADDFVVLFYDIGIYYSTIIDVGNKLCVYLI